MVHAVDFYIPVDDNTIRDNLALFCPDNRDDRILDREYRFRILPITEDVGIRMTTLDGSIKCHDKSDVLSIINNLKSILEANLSKIGEGAYLAIHYCRQVEDDKPTEPCSIEKVWVR